MGFLRGFLIFGFGFVVYIGDQCVPKRTRTHEGAQRGHSQTSMVSSAPSPIIIYDFSSFATFFFFVCFLQIFTVI